MTAAALWIGARLSGHAAPDDLLAALVALDPDAAPAVRIDGAAPQPLAGLLGPLVGQVGAWLVLPRPGSTLGWPREVLDAPRPAVLVTGPPGAPGAGSAARPALLLRHDRGGWVTRQVRAPEVLALEAAALPPRAAARRFTTVLDEAAQRLSRLGLDRPPAAPAPTRWRAALRPLPPGTTAELAALVTRIGDLRDLLDLALAEDGAAVTAAEADARARGIRSVADQLDDLLVALLAFRAVTASAAAR